MSGAKYSNTRIEDKKEEPDTWSWVSKREKQRIVESLEGSCDELITLPADACLQRKLKSSPRATKSSPLCFHDNVCSPWTGGWWLTCGVQWPGAYASCCELVPSKICMLVELTQFTVGNTPLMGTIPSEIGSLIKLSKFPPQPTFHWRYHGGVAEASTSSQLLIYLLGYL